MVERISTTWGNETITLQTGLMAKQADGAVLVTYGGTAVLTTVVAEKKLREGVDFLPLTVDYREKTYAAGRIPGGFFKRETRPGDKETLTSRLIDRPIRPLFPKGYFFETQVISLVLSADQKNDPDILAMLGASTALLVSDIPFKTNIAAVRIGLIDGEFIINPTFEQVEESTLDMIVAATEDAVAMVECFSKEVPEDTIIDAIEFAHKAIQPIIKLQREFVEKCGKDKWECEAPVHNEEVRAQAKAFVLPRIPEIYSAPDKQAKQNAIKKIAQDLVESFGEEPEPDVIKEANYALEETIKEELRNKIFSEGIRVDGRKVDEVRPIECHVGVLPMTHGSALFTRGETQCLTTITCGTSSDYQRIDSLEGESKKSFMLHYNFPPFSVGEVRFLRGPGRREIGHGMLAEKAVAPLVPKKDEFPYTLRIVCEILESNGSSSMASVCGSTLAMMDAGVPIKKPVAGVAMGLIKKDDNFQVITDILGTEDAIGDMDLKVAGTRDGITAIQMDMKITGIPREVIQNALQKAKDGRLHILSIMEKTLSGPRAEMSPHAPRIIQLKINPDKIRDVIGPGGKIIKGLIEKTGAEINVSDDGTIEIASVNQEKGKLAEKLILELIEEAQIGKIYLGTVKRIEPYGAFIGILPGVDGLLHISQIADYHVQNIEDELKEGDEVLVKLIDIDKFGRVKLSRKAALKESEGGDSSVDEDNEKKPVENEPTDENTPKRPTGKRPPYQKDRNRKPRSDDRKSSGPRRPQDSSRSSAPRGKGRPNSGRPPRRDNKS